VRGRLAADGSAHDTPSIDHGTRNPMMSAIVGTRSTCSQLTSVVDGARWPERLMNSGTQSTGAAVVLVTLARPGSPGLNAMPWSAVTSSSERS
jgi:hypothetical protein